MNNSIEDTVLNLPHDVLVTELLSRLSVKTLFVLRSVCKEFLGLIDCPVRRQYDGSAARRRRRKNPFLLFYVDDPDESVKDPNLGFHVFDFLGPGSARFSSRRYSTFDLPSPRRWTHTHSGYSICRGLACFVNIPSGQWSVHITVVNPSTRERVCIPESPNSAIGYRVGFGFLSSTNEYKIILLTYPRKQKEVMGCEIFSLTHGGDPGSSSWRQIANRPPKYELAGKHLCVDGVIYWVILNTRAVLAFDLETEQFTTIAPPVGTARFPVPTLMDWGGSLCMLQRCLTGNRTRGSKNKIWILNSGHDDKKKKKKNVTLYGWIRQQYEIEMKSCSTTVSRSPGININHFTRHVREEEEDLLVLDIKVDDHDAKNIVYTITSVSSYNNKGRKRLVKVYNKEVFFNINHLMINGAPLVYFETLFALTPCPSYNSNKEEEEEKVMLTYIDPSKLSSYEYLNKKMMTTHIDPRNFNVIGALDAICDTLTNLSIH